MVDGRTFETHFIKSTGGVGLQISIYYFIEYISQYTFSQQLVPTNNLKIYMCGTHAVLMHPC